MLHVGGSFIEHACYHQLTNDEIDATLEDLLISHLKSTGRLKSYLKGKQKEKGKKEREKDSPISGGMEWVR